MSVWLGYTFAYKSRVELGYNMATGNAYGDDMNKVEIVLWVPYTLFLFVHYYDV